MGGKRHTAEQIIRKLREAEVELAKGQTTADVARKLGITEQSPTTSSSIALTMAGRCGC